MLVYLTVMFLCSILLYAMRNNNNKVTPLAITFGMIWLMIALQDGWGGDHMAYINHLDYIKGLNFYEIISDDTHGAVGYKLIMWLMPDIHTAQVVGLAIWCFSMAFFFYHFVPQKWWFFAILFVFFDRAILMGMVSSFLRMAIANSFLIFAIYYVSKSKRVVAGILIFVGAFFHQSVLGLLPLVFVSTKPTKRSLSFILGLFAVIAIVSIVFPSSWTNLVESVILGVDSLAEYAFYFEDSTDVQSKGLILIVLFYWVYLLSKQKIRQDLSSQEYLMLNLALIRIAFDLLPAFGLSVRYFYYFDIYFFAGMMWLLNRLHKNDANIYGIASTLLIVFWFLGYHTYSKTPFFKECWSFYNFIF